MPALQDVVCIESAPLPFAGRAAVAVGCNGSACCYWNGYESREATRLRDAPSVLRSSGMERPSRTVALRVGSREPTSEKTCQTTTATASALFK